MLQNNDDRDCSSQPRGAAPVSAGAGVAGAAPTRSAAGPCLLEVLRSFVVHPRATLLRRWNWKSAVMSSLVRASLFFFVNLTAGAEAAVAAFLTELVYRAMTSGFYGAITQGFSRVQPAWQATLGACVVLPLANHSLELLAHWLRGTERLWESIFASICFTALSTAFHVFVMRRGLLTVGEGSQSLWRDLAQMPRSVALFVAAPFVWVYRWWKGSAWADGPGRVSDF